MSNTQWIIVYFTDDHCVEAVPESWFNTIEENCAWPVKTKLAKKIIQSYQKPNKKEFTYHPARKMGKKSYASLAEAQTKLPRASRMSDLSSAEEINTNIKRKKTSGSVSPNLIKTKYIKSTNKLFSQPLPYSSFIKKNVIEEPSKQVRFDSDSGADNSDSDPTWKLGSNSPQNTSCNNDNDIIPPSPSPVKLIEKNYQVLCSPSSSKWSVEKDGNMFKEQSNNCMTARRVLFQDNNKHTNKPEPFQKKPIETFKSEDDFKKYIFTTLTHMKYDINNIMNVVNINNRNIEILMDNSHGSSTMNSTLFPIYNDEELSNVESKIINDEGFRNILVSKMSLSVIASDLGQSIRRIMARLFGDTFLLNYSLIGFKKKKPFSKLMIYRVLIDSLRMHVKFKMVTEREIEIPLGVWLAHARSRLISKEKKN